MDIKRIWQKLLNKNAEKSSSAEADHEDISAKYNEILYLLKQFDGLLSQDRFLARSDYKELAEQCQLLRPRIEMFLKSAEWEKYSRNTNVDSRAIDRFMLLAPDIADVQKESVIIKDHNDRFIARHLESEKSYLDHILEACDPTIRLDHEQREVVLSDEDYTLVIAGAGAGKTTTIAAKVRYLVDIRKIDPQQILVISFTNKAVEELRERINGALGIPCPISTFHSVGYTILRQGEAERKKVVDNGFLYYVITKYLKESVLSQSEMVDKLVLFFGSYFSAPYTGKQLNEYFQFITRTDHSTLRGSLPGYIKEIVDRKTRKTVTLNNETVRSTEEVRIANFLYINQIDYEYEPIYQYPILDSNKPYTPDFLIRQGDRITYIEHFGITENGENNLYSPETLQKYKKRINEKILLHKRHKTDLIYTFSSYNDGRDFLLHLKEKLIEHGYQLEKRSSVDVYRKIADSEEDRYITRLVVLLCTFINNFKTQGFRFDQFKQFRQKTKNIRTKIFLDICSNCFLEYQKQLQERHCIDFQDMINESAELLNNKRLSHDHVDYKYIIVDEYQDISRQRYHLVQALSTLCKAKIVAVGDDWQSIYAFSGSILPLFTRFCQEVGYGQELQITRTYRNAQEIIDIAGTFVQKNSAQIKKALISPKTISNPVIIYPYSEEYDKKSKTDGGKYHFLGIAVNQAIENILSDRSPQQKGKTASLLLIGRYGFDARNLCYSKEFNYDEKSGRVYSVKYGSRVKILFLTAHSSKGLSADNVIIINAKDEAYGFPSKIEDDPILNLVVANDTSYSYAEERRLFYVALTRTRNRVYIVTPQKRPSEFIKELLSDPQSYPNVTLKGELDSDMTKNTVSNSCPICGFPMQLRWNKNYGLKLWMCSNDQEVCGFMTNDRRGGDLSIQKCDWCHDGFLIVKKSNNDFFLGCTNYKPDRSGCGRMLNRVHYHSWLQNDFGRPDRSADRPSFFQPALLPVNESTDATPKTGRTKPIPKTPAPPKSPQVHTVDYQKQKVGTENFTIVMDDQGNILTDMKLLQNLRQLRGRLIEQNIRSASRLLTNDILVALSTEKPVTREEMMSINGIGNEFYDRFGKIIIDYIKRSVNA